MCAYHHSAAPDNMSGGGWRRALWSVTVQRYGWMRKVYDGFATLEGSPRELWLAYLLKYLDSFGYFAWSVLCTLYLTDEFGVSDTGAGFAYGLYGALIVSYGLVVGGLVDFFGVRACLVASYVLGAASRLVLATTTSRQVLLGVIYGPLALSGGSIGILTVGIRRYTNRLNRGFAFGLFYTVMNVAALSSGMVLDVFRVKLRDGFGTSGDHRLVWNNGIRLLVLLTSVGSLCAAALAWQLREIEVQEDSPLTEPGNSTPSLEMANMEGHLTAPEESDHLALLRGETHGHSAPGPHTPQLTRGSGKDKQVGAFSLRRRPPLAVVKELLVSREFWKFFAMTAISINLKSIFRHLDATLPKYQIRAFGCTAHVGAVYSINPLMIVFLVPFMSALTTHHAHFDMIHYGGYVSALSPFWMALFPSTEWSTVLFVVTLSVGEAIWSPRWYDYTMTVAPKGNEGTFSALAAAPIFAAKLPTGLMSGYLLERYCPKVTDCTESYSGSSQPSEPAGALGTSCDGQAIWTIVGVLTLSSPLAILVLQRWLRPASLPRPGNHRCEQDLRDSECVPKNAAESPGPRHREPSHL